MPSRELKVVITGDSRNLERAFARSQKSAQQFQAGVTGRMAKVDAGLTKLGAGRAALLGGFAGAGVGLIAPKVIDDIQAAVAAASDLNEQITKNQQVFGASAKQVQDWSTTTAKSIGVSQSAALAATGTFGNLFTAIGITGPAAAGMSRNLVQLAADLASFNNASIEDTLDAIRSGLVGEAEPLRRYGVLLSETRVAQVAMAQTGKTSAKALTDQEKAAARVAIIFRDTGKAQGDFARTSSGLANQQRILKAEVADLQANLGNLLLPAMVKITGALTDATGAALTLVDALHSLGNVKIPTIHIPILADIGGGTIGGAVGSLGPHIKAFFKNLPVNRLVIEGVQQLADKFDLSTKQQQPYLQFRFGKSVQDLIAYATKPTPLKPAADFAKLPGIDTGTSLAEDFGSTIDKLFAAAKGQVATAIRKGKAAVAKAAAEEAAKKRSDAFAKAIASLQLGIDKADLTRSLRDDLEALNALKAGLQRQIKAGVDVQSAQSQLYSVRGQIASKQEQIRTRADETAQARQFRAIGLSATGGEIIPGVENLRKQFASLSKRVVGEDVPSKLLARLRLVGKALHGGIKDIKEPTRQAINDLFDMIRGEFDKGSKKLEGPLTKTTSLNTKAALANVTGLNRDQLKQIRANLSSFNSAGVALAGSATGAPITVNTNTTINLDGETVARNTTKHQQKANRRNPPQKRGPNRRGI